MFKIVNCGNQAVRSFRLTIGLVEGYKEGKVHTPKEVGKVVADWLLSQRERGQPYLPGSVTPTVMHYYGRESKKIIAEPAVFYEGDVSPEYNAELTDNAVISALQGLVEALMEELRQTRMYLRYRDTIQILERR